MYEEAEGASGQPGGCIGVSNIFVFDELDVYAPNGSEYTYIVKEVKEELGGYDTWVVSGDISNCSTAAVNEAKTDKNLQSEDPTARISEITPETESGDEPQVRATFINAPQEEPENMRLIFVRTSILQDSLLRSL